jgi:nucleotide-binding universal stress UspA family protein
MLPIRNILHPTDFSDRSELALKLASALARDYKANLTILHVAQEPVILFTEGIIPPPADDHLQEVREQLESIEPADPDVSVTHQLVEGNPATEILRVADMTNADLIVLGTHGRRGLKRFLMGSVAEYVMERATCPVLTVKTPAERGVPVPDVTMERMVGIP